MSTDKMYFYERHFADVFDEKMNMYDLRMRLKLVYGDFLKENLQGKKLLDAGCGTGYFSKAAVERGADVTSMDLGENLLAKVKEKCNSTCVKGSILEMPFEDNSFDYVISSEVIEHVPAPLDAIPEIYRVLKPDGTMVLTTPNKHWHFAIDIANAMKLRPYQGLENWVSLQELRNSALEAGFKVVDESGLHLFPFVTALSHPVLNFFHRWRRPLRTMMLNIAIKCVKV